MVEVHEPPPFLTRAAKTLLITPLEDTMLGDVRRPAI
jgi:hypothetical protein